MEENFNKSNIFIVENLNETKDYIEKLAKAKDVVLFVNDLPDYYK